MRIPSPLVDQPRTTRHLSGGISLTSGLSPSFVATGSARPRSDGKEGTEGFLAGHSSTSTKGTGSIMHYKDGLDPNKLDESYYVDGYFDEVDGNGHGTEVRVAQLRQALVNQARIIVELRREVERLRMVEETAFPRRKKFSTM